MREIYKKIIKTIFINYFIFVCAVVTLELAGQILFYLVNGKFIYQSLQQKNLFIEHPYLVGVPARGVSSLSPDGKIKVTIDSLGFRTTGAANDSNASKKTVVVCVGGSTTFGTSVTDEHTWPFILQKKLGPSYRVYNLGVPGYSTVEAIIQLSTIIPPLSPDVVIFYAGWNDLRNYHVQPPSPDYYWHGMSQRTSLMVGRKNFSRDLTDRLALFHFTKWIGHRFLNQDQVPPPVFETSDEKDPYVDSLYVRNLVTLQAICKRFHYQSIFVPQVVNKEAFFKSDRQSRWWTPHIPDKKLPEFMGDFNLLMEKNVVEDKSTRVIKDILNDHAWNGTYFVDDGHFSEKGAEYFTNLIIEAGGFVKSSKK